MPRQIAPGSDWLAISPDAGNLLVALKTNGTLWLRSRRFNAAGVDGLTQVGSASDWSAVDAGRDSLFARMKDGSWWVCGWNSLRQLGFGETDGWFPSPKRLPFDFDPWAFAPGEGTTLLLGQDGQLGTWGWRWDDRMGMLCRYPAPELTVPIRH